LDRVPELPGEIERLRAFCGAAEIELEWHPRSRGRDWSPRWRRSSLGSVGLRRVTS